MATHRTFERSRRPSAKPDFGRCEGIVSSRILRALYSAAAEYESLGVPYVVIGGLAVGAYGAPRATKDVDFLVGEEAFEHHGPIVSFLPGLPIASGDVPVDPVSIAQDEGFLLKSLDEPFRSREVAIVDLPALIYLKLSAGRHRDLDDVERLIQAGVDEAPIRKYLEKHAPDLVAAYERCR